MNGGKLRILKEVAAYFKISRNSPGDRTTEDTSHNIRSIIEASYFCNQYTNIVGHKKRRATSKSRSRGWQLRIRKVVC